MDCLNSIKKEREYVPDFMYIQSLEEYCGQLENVIGAIANIDGAFITPEGDCDYTDKQALEKIMEWVDPIWSEIAKNSRRNRDASK